MAWFRCGGGNSPIEFTARTYPGSGCSGGYYHAAGTIDCSKYNYAKVTAYTQSPGTYSSCSIGFNVGTQVDVSSVDTITYDLGAYGSGSPNQTTMTIQLYN